MHIIPITLLAVSIYLFVGIRLIARARGKWKWVVGVVLLLLPFWDYVPRQLYFGYLCKYRVGESLRTPAPEVAGIRVWRQSRDNAKSYLTADFPFVEFQDPRGRIVRYRLDERGDVIEENPGAFQYRYDYDVVIDHLWFGVSRIRYVVLDLESRRAVYQTDTFGLGASWWFRLWKAGDTYRAECPEIADIPTELDVFRAAFSELLVPSNGVSR